MSDLRLHLSYQYLDGHHFETFHSPALPSPGDRLTLRHAAPGQEASLEFIIPTPGRPLQWGLSKTSCGQPLPVEVQIELGEPTAALVE